MKTQEIINNIESNGGLDYGFIKMQARREGVTVEKYITNYIKANFACTLYVAKKVAQYYAL